MIRNARLLLPFLLLLAPLSASALDARPLTAADLDEIGGRVLAVSQFTLAGSIRKGRRPSFDHAMTGGEAEPLFDRFVELLRGHGVQVETGVFGAMMEVELVNDGPVTLIWESRK